MKWQSSALAVFVSLSLAAPGTAEQGAVGPPATINGIPNAPAPILHQGVKYYPAVVIQEVTGIIFTYDRATETLYANGAPSPLEPLVHNQQVYLPMEPFNINLSTDHRDETWRTNPNMPGQTAFEARRHRIERIFPDDRQELQRTDDYYRPYETSLPDHPWMTTPVLPPMQAQSIDPTYERGKPAHMQPGAAPPEPEFHPESLPDRLPPPGTPSHPVAVSSPPPTETGVPLRVTSQGGAPQQEPQPTIQANPYASPGVALDAPRQRFSRGFRFIPQGAKNSVFEVYVKDAKITRNLNGVFPAAKNRHFVAVRVAQRNHSFVLQVEPGTFALRDDKGDRYVPDEELSQMEMSALAPGDVRAGLLVFDLPASAVPDRLELEGTMPLKVPLQDQ